MLFNDLFVFLVVVIVSGFFKSCYFFFLFHFVCGALVWLTQTNQR